MNQSIQVRIVSQFGNERIFPVCETAKNFAAIAKCVTLTRDVIDHIKAIGFEVKVVHDTETL